MAIKIERVLAATDFSQAGQRAVGVAAEWAREAKAQLRIVHVTPPKSWLSGAWNLKSSVADTIQQHAANALKQQADSADAARTIELSTGVLSGPAARSIVRAARGKPLMTARVPADIELCRVKRFGGVRRVASRDKPR